MTYITDCVFMCYEDYMYIYNNHVAYPISNHNHKPNGLKPAWSINLGIYYSLARRPDIQTETSVESRLFFFSFLCCMFVCTEMDLYLAT